MTAPRAAAIRETAANYFDKGRCSGHAQFDGRYCRDAAGPEQWCIHCAGFLLLTLLDTGTRELEELRAENQRLLARSGRPDVDTKVLDRRASTYGGSK